MCNRNLTFEFTLPDRTFAALLLLLKTNTVYTCKVQAHNDAGYGPFSEPATARTTNFRKFEL